MKRPSVKGPDLSGLRAKLSKLKDTEVKLPKLKAPKLKRPEGEGSAGKGSGVKLPSVRGLKGPSIRRPQLKGPDVNVPEPVRGLYNDLRERHLLIVVAALLVAIVAVPLLVRSDAEQAPPPAPIVDVDEGLPLDPAVVASNPGLRDFHERLDSLRARNPFKQQLVPSDREVESSNLTREGDSGAAAGDDGGTGTGTGTTDVDTGTGTGTDVPGGDSGSADGGRDEKPETMILESRIDVKIGLPGGGNDVQKGVEVLALLPDADNPVLQYAGSDRNGKGASFVVSRDVVSVSGDGVCKPRPADCQFLHLKVGQRKRLNLSGGDSYTIKLLEVAIERVPARSASKAAGADQAGELDAAERPAPADRRDVSERGRRSQPGPLPGLVAEPVG